MSAVRAIHGPVKIVPSESQVLPETRLVEGRPTLHEITSGIAHPLESRPGKAWWICLALAVAALLNLGGMVAYLVGKGVGIWGLNNSVGWAFDITNFVFWVGIGHAGTLISAILLLFRQQWRTSINRSAEAMTIFAVICSGMFPAIHMGRPWDAFFIFPYPNQRGPLWINFRSPLVWHVFAISTYLTISLVFWYLGMIPDLATMRDRTKDPVKKFIFRILSLGWNGSHRTWSRYELVSLILAGLATPLVLSVHSVVSMDFATSVIPGWHTTIFPPYFVAGAIYSGFGMVLTLLILVVSLHRSLLPSAWCMFYPTMYDVGILVGSFGLFFTCFLIFIRVLPMIAMWEIKGVVAHSEHKRALSSDEDERAVAGD